MPSAARQASSTSGGSVVPTLASVFRPTSRLSNVRPSPNLRLATSSTVTVAPTISGPMPSPGMTTIFIALPSIDLDAGGVHDLAPGVELLLDHRAEFRRRALDRLRALLDEALADRLAGGALVDRRIERRGDVGRQALRPHDAPPRAHLEARHAGLDHRGHLREQRRARLPRAGQQLHAIALHL